MESTVPGFADNAIATAGTETFTYDFSGLMLHSGLIESML